jgi:hypothetical protein
MVQAYSQKIFNGQKPVFDGRKNMYSRDPLPIGRDKVKPLPLLTAPIFRLRDLPMEKWR